MKISSVMEKSWMSVSLASDYHFSFWTVIGTDNVDNEVYSHYHCRQNDFHSRILDFTITSQKTISSQCNHGSPSVVRSIFAFPSHWYNCIFATFFNTIEQMSEGYIWNCQRPRWWISDILELRVSLSARMTFWIAQNSSQFARMAIYFLLDEICT